MFNRKPFNIYHLWSSFRRLYADIGLGRLPSDSNSHHFLYPHGFFGINTPTGQWITKIVDAAVPLNGQGSAVAAVASDQCSKWLGAGRVKTFWKTPMEAEMVAIKLGLQLESQLRTSQLLILSDAVQVVKILHGPFISCPWTVRHLYVECKARLSYSGGPTVTYK